MLPAELFLSLRYLRPKRTFVSVITLLSILGPTLGVAVLLIVMSVMDGFQKDIKTGIMNMQAHLQVQQRYQNVPLQPEKIMTELRKHGVDCAPMIEGSALLQLKKNIAPKVVRGINPKMERKVSALARNIREGKYEIKDGEAIIGDTMAYQFGLSVGDTFLLHSPSRLTKNVVWKDDGSVEMKKTDEVYLPETVKVAGIFSFGVSDYDNNIIYLTQDQAADLYGMEWGSATSIQGHVQDPINIQPLADKLKTALPYYSVLSWQEQNRMLFGTLRVEKNLMTFLLAFIVLVASFSIAATLITVVVQKTREVGILNALGFSRMAIGRVFFLQGIFIGTLGTFLGTLLGLAILHWREQIASILSWIMGHDVFPAELYHLKRIPALTTPGDLAFTILLSLLICVLASVVPALYASRLSPAKALQDDN